MYPAARGTGLCHLERSGVPCECCAPENTVNQGKVPPARAAILRFQALTLPKMSTQCHVVTVAIHSSSHVHALGCGFSKKQTKQKKPRSSAHEQHSSYQIACFCVQCVCGVQKKRSNRHSIRALDCAPRASMWFCSVRK